MTQIVVLPLPRPHLLVLGVPDDLPLFLPKLGEVDAGRGLAAPPSVLQRTHVVRGARAVREGAKAGGLG